MVPGRSHFFLSLGCYASGNLTTSLQCPLSLWTVAVEDFWLNGNSGATIPLPWAKTRPVPGEILIIT